MGGPVGIEILPRSALVRASASKRLEEVEASLDREGLTLGPLPDHLLSLTVREWLEGPWAGLRAIPGGRLESAAMAITAELPEGRIYKSVEAPRSAAGPDLKALFLGGRGRFGAIASATLRAFPIPQARRALAHRFPKWPAAVRALRRCVQREVAIAWAYLRPRPGAFEVGVSVEGAAVRIPRDASVWEAEATQAGGTAAEHLSIRLSAASDAEVGWDELAGISPEADLILYRLARESVEVVCERPLGAGIRLWPDAADAPPSGPFARL